ncbi:MAG: hypothetical protein ACLQHW_12425 [bacterium]
MAARALKTRCRVLERISPRGSGYRAVLYETIICSNDVVAVTLTLADMGYAELVRPGIVLLEPCKVAARRVIVGGSTERHGSVRGCHMVALRISSLVAHVTVQACGGLVRPLEQIRSRVVLREVRCHRLGLIGVVHRVAALALRNAA